MTIVNRWGAIALAVAAWAVVPTQVQSQTQTPQAPAAATTSTMLVCGGPEVLRLNLRFTGDKAEIVSRTDWRADTSRGMPKELVDSFRTTDDCKPIDDNVRVLVTSSSGGVAIIDRESGDTLFHTTVANAHSAEVLPRNRVVVAASVAPKGDRLVLFDRSSGATELFSTPLPSGHGAHWIASEQTLWALGRTELRAYDLVEWETTKPSLKLRKTYTLPTTDGHDLSPVPNSSSLIVTTGTQVLTFDRKTGAFAPYSSIGALPVVKSVTIHPTTGRVAFTQADKPEWWTRTIRFLGPSASLVFPNDRLYKVRWVP